VVSPDTVIERANAADTSVYVVTMPSYTHLLASTKMTPLPTPLDVTGLVDRTGGRSIYANEGDMGPLFRAIAEEVASAYVIGFYPPPENRRDGKLHQVRIEGPAGLTLRQSRAGYVSQKAVGSRQKVPCCSSVLPSVFQNSSSSSSSSALSSSTISS